MTKIAILVLSVLLGVALNRVFGHPCPFGEGWVCDPANWEAICVAVAFGAGLLGVKVIPWTRTKNADVATVKQAIEAPAEEAQVIAFKPREELDADAQREINDNLNKGG